MGTRDDTLTLDTPAYGSTVTSPVRAGGVITGVDESLHLQVRRASAPAVLGDLCCLPAGGEAQPWSAEVPFRSGRGGGALTLVVWTGGHVADVERFAVTGLRTP